MTLLALSALLASLAGAQLPAQVLDSTLGIGGFTPDLGCATGLPAASRFPRNVYNPTTHERILSNVSLCTGGFIRAWNEQTNTHWNMELYAGGGASGRDETGARWTYDPKLKQFTVLASGKTCSTSDVRHVCG